MRRDMIRQIAKIVLVVALVLMLLPTLSAGADATPVQVADINVSGASSPSHHTGALGKPEPEASSAMTLAEAPADLRGAVSAALGHDAYRIARSEAGPHQAALHATNPANGLDLRFSSDGAVLSPSTGARWRWGLTLAAYGHRGHLLGASATPPVLAGDRVTYARAGITEWYANDPRGLEQGFTVGSRLPAAADGPLVLRLAVSGTLTPALEDGSVLLSPPGAAPVLTYGDLVATDASGRVLPSRIGLDGETIVLRVRDAGARYPITIDPLVAGQEAKLTASDRAASDLFGFSVALDGGTAVVGAEADDTPGGVDAGSAYVFVRSGTTWTQQQQLTASDGAPSDEFGVSVAVDGDTAVVGAYAHDTPGGTRAGSAYVFVRSGTTWTQQQQLTASDGAPADRFGFSVAVDGDSA